MPIPFLIAGIAAAAAGVVGVGGHINAKETNEEAQRVAKNAQNLYNRAKESMEKAKANTETKLIQLANTKKNVLETTMKTFIASYDRLKKVSFNSDTDGLNELNKFSITPQDMLRIQEMTNIYESAGKNTAVGVISGTVITAAAGGSLVGAATLGAVAAPLAVVAAPAVLFTGISASIKAEENLSKAKQMKAEAEVAAEKMKANEILCNGITEKAVMFNDLTYTLNSLFSKCVVLLDQVVKSKTSIFKRQLKREDLTQEELKLFAVTGSIAKALKTAIDTPIMDSSGDISYEADEKYELLSDGISGFENQVQMIEQNDYGIAPHKLEKANNRINSANNAKSGLPDAVRNVFAIFISLTLALGVYTFTDSISVTLITFSAISLLFSDANSKIKLFKNYRFFSVLGMSAGFGLLLYSNCLTLIDMKHFIICDIVLGVISFFVCICIFSNDNINNLLRLISGISGVICLGTIALLLIGLLHVLLTIPFVITMIVVEILYVICSLFVFAMLEP